MTQSPENTQTEGDKPQQDDVSNDKQPSAQPPKEVGGRDGPDPTRFGDWEKGGRCIDF